MEHQAAYFNVGDLILFGKYKNKKGRIVGFSVDDKGQPVVEIEPVPKGQKQNKKLTLFKIRRAPKTASNVALKYMVACRYAATKTRQIGRCGFCGRDIRCPNNALAAHGYRRPGTGQTFGNCPGTGYPPLEISPATVKLAVEFYTQETKSLERELREIPKATELPHPWLARRSLKKSDANEHEWQQAVESTTQRTTRQLEFATEALEKLQTAVREWKAKPLHEFTEVSKEEQRKKKQETVRVNRMDRYNALKKKAVGRLDKAFSALKQREAKARSKPTPKNFEMVAKSGNAIYQVVGGLNKLWMVHPDGYYDMIGEPISEADIMKDFDRDTMWKHMGLLKNGRYLSRKSSEFQELEDDTSSANYGYKGENWRPKWPGFKG